MKEEIVDTHLKALKINLDPRWVRDVRGDRSGAGGGPLVFPRRGGRLHEKRVTATNAENRNSKNAIMNKQSSKPVLVCAFGLLAAFFMPWVQLFGAGMSGYNLGSLGSYGNYAWVIPILAGGTILLSFTGVNNRGLGALTGIVPLGALVYALIRVSNEGGSSAIGGRVQVCPTRFFHRHLPNDHFQRCHPCCRFHITNAARACRPASGLSEQCSSGSEMPHCRRNRGGLEEIMLRSAGPLNPDPDLMG